MLVEFLRPNFLQGILVFNQRFTFLHANCVQCKKKAGNKVIESLYSDDIRRTFVNAASSTY